MAKGNLTIIKMDFSRRWWIVSGQDLHQSRFAGTVLPNQRVDLTATNREVNVIECQYPGEPFRDAAHA
jgi:hypothetical protein